MVRLSLKMWLAVACVGFCAMPVVATSGDQPAPDDEILISGDRVQITRSDLERYLEVRVPQEQRAAVLARPDAIRQLLSQLYITRTLASEARDLADLDKEALQWRIDLERDRVLRDALIDLRVAERAANAQWDELAREHYTANRETYEVPERVRVSHVLIEATDRGQDEARALAEELVRRAEAGEDFAELAKTYSDDPSAASNSGDLGFFEQGQMVPEFEQAAFALSREGEIAGPVESQFGFHVIRFVERQEQRLRPFDDVRESIIRDLRTRQAATIRNNEIERVRAAEGIVVDHEAVERAEADIRAAGSVPQN